MLLAALLIFAGLGLWVLGFGEVAFSAGPEILDLPLADRIQVFARGEAPAMHRFALGVAALAWAFWLEALARVLALLKHRNRQQASA